MTGRRKLIIGSLFLSFYMNFFHYVYNICLFYIIISETNLNVTDRWKKKKYEKREFS